LWYRLGVNTTIKCDHINKNLAESFNNRIKDLKDLPVHDMVVQIRITTMRLWELRARIGDKLQGQDKLPAVVQQVVNRSRELAHLCVVKSSLHGGEVRDTKTTRTHIVDTKNKECSCLEWQHTEKPCAIIFWHLNPS
jgi:predicted Rdx family selenoprotein